MAARLLALLVLSVSTAPVLRSAWRQRRGTAKTTDEAPKGSRNRQPTTAAASSPRYAATVTGFSTWVDRYFDRVPAPYPLVAVATGIAIYLVGLGFTSLYGFHRTYVETFAVYPWIISIVWMLGVVRWATSRTRRMLLDLRPVFLEPDEAYERAIDCLDRRCHSRKIAVGVVVVSALALWATVADIVDRSLYPIGFSVYPSTRNLPGPWYETHDLPNLLILGVFEIVCTALLVSALWYLAASMWFLVDIRNFRTVPVPGVVLTRCRSIANFYLIAFYAAFVGVGLYVVLAKNSLDTPTLVTVGALSLLCALPAMVPQMVFHRFLSDADLEMASVATRLYYQHLSLQSGPLGREDRADDGRAMADGLGLWLSIMQVATPSRTWIYDFSAIALLLLGEAITIGATVGTVFLRDRFGVG